MNTASTTSASGLAAPTSAVDPVCGMAVQADKAAARIQYEGKLYLFSTFVPNQSAQHLRVVIHRICTRSFTWTQASSNSSGCDRCG